MKLLFAPIALPPFAAKPVDDASRAARWQVTPMRIALLLALPALAAAAVPGSVPSIDALIENGHWKRARAQAEADYKANPKDARTVYRLARVRHVFGNLDEAAKL